MRKKPSQNFEEGVRIKRRIGCGFFLAALVVSTALVSAILYLLFLRPNPNPVLTPWIPPESDMAASIELDFSGEALGGLARIFLVAEGSLAPEERDQILKVLDDLVRMAVYPRVLVAGQIEPESLEAKWAVVGNIRRGQSLLEPLSKQLFGDEIRWATERLANRSVKTMRLENYGLQGMIHASQLVVSNNPQWLEQVAQQRSRSEASAFDRIGSADVPIRVAIDDRRYQVREVLREFAQYKSDPEIAMAAGHLLQLLEQSQGKITIDVWLLVKEAKVIIRPQAPHYFDEAALNRMAADVQKELGELLGLPKVQLAKVTDYKAAKSLEISVPAFGYLLSQAFE